MDRQFKSSPTWRQMVEDNDNRLRGIALLRERLTEAIETTRTAHPYMLDQDIDELIVELRERSW